MQDCVAMLDLANTTLTYLTHLEVPEIFIAQVACSSAGRQHAPWHQWSDRCHFTVRHMWLMLAAARITEGPISLALADEITGRKPLSLENSY
jgi:hypothetical protein